jgi:hypothetical protein
MDASGMAARRAKRLRWLRERVGIVLAAVVLSAALSACAALSAQGRQGAPHHSRVHVVTATHTDTASRQQPRQVVAAFRTTRTFQLGAGRATRTFTLRERDGVILLNRLTVPAGVRVFVDASIPTVAEVKIWSWESRNDPSLSCRRHGAFDVCTQFEEWCPMPQATWRFRLVKVSGPAGPIRFQYVVAAPPAGLAS